MLTRAEVIASLTAPGQKYELTVTAIGDAECRTFGQAPQSLRELYDVGRSDAIYYSYAGEHYTFQDAWDKAARVAQVLRDECGVHRGDRVAISMRNYPEWVFAFMATTSLGAIAVALNAWWSADELAHALDSCEPTVLVVDAERLALVRDMDVAAEMVILVVRSPGRDMVPGRDLEQLIAMREPVMPEATIAPDDDALILFTSGSTGYPKGAVSTNRAVLSALLSWELDARVRAIETGLLELGEEPEPPEAQPVWLLTVPLFHASGSHAFMLSAFRSQKRVIAMYRWDVEEASTIIETERVHVVLAAPAVTGDLVKYAADSGRDLSSLQVVGGGGAARAPEQVRQIASVLNAMPNIGWGMTETNAIGTGISGSDYLLRPTSSGRSSAILDLRVVDGDGQPVAAGERGELQVRGPSLFREYWRRPDANADAFTAGGWFRTGDLAVVDQEGWLYLVDRLKDLVIRGGENIGCGAVEAALLEHPSVHEAAVYSVPDERLGDEVGATVFADPAVSESGLQQFVAGLLSPYEIPRYIEILPEPLPRIASGKIFKRELQARTRTQLGLEMLAELREAAAEPPQQEPVSAGGQVERSDEKAIPNPGRSGS